MELTLDNYSMRSVARGEDAIGKAVSTDVIEASARAYLSAVNKLLVKEKRSTDAK